MQLTAAASAAWIIAKQIGDHNEPFFAPIAALAALSSPLGERGSNAIRLLLGVVVGILAGEITVAVLGAGNGRLALAAFVAMAAARALGGTRLVIVQAAGGAILTIAAADGDADIHRLVDAGIGAGVALVFSQVLFSPEPVALVRRAATTALTDMAEALASTAQALEHHDVRRAETATEQLRDLRDSLAELARLRQASTRVARHSMIWRSRIAPTVVENENAGHLDLLGVSCLTLARTAMATSGAESSALAPSVKKLADALEEMAKDLGDRATRQGAVDQVLGVARHLANSNAPVESTMTAAVIAVEMVIVDVVVFAGVAPEAAAALLRDGTGAFSVATPPATPRLPFLADRPWRRQR